jgi:hypothetical protein
MQRLHGGIDVRWTGPDIALPTDLRLWCGDEQLDAKMRKALLADLRAGKAMDPISLDAVTYIQRPTPNRNYVRHKKGGLASLAKSYRGAPFLRDHGSGDLLTRGGTILTSALKRPEADDDDGDYEFQQRIELVKLWAIEGVLDGTIDRFSIAWMRTGPVECSIHGTQVFRECDCWPGEMVNGRQVEFVFTSAEGTEVSAVNVPAVVGTGIKVIGQLSQLSGVDRAALRDILADEPPQQPRKEHHMDPELLAALGLPATATKAEALKIIGERSAQGVQLDALREQLEVQAEAQRATTIDAAIQRLTSTGKIKPGGKVELSLRAMASSGSEIKDPSARSAALAASLDLFTKQVNELTGSPSVTPAGAALPAVSPDPVKPAAPLGQTLDGKAYLAAKPSAAGWLKRAGITQEQFDKHGASAREHVAQMSAIYGH